MSVHKKAEICEWDCTCLIATNCMYIHNVHVCEYDRNVFRSATASLGTTLMHTHTMYTHTYTHAQKQSVDNAK